MRAIYSQFNMNYQEIEGDLIKLAKQGKFDVITHGCNCLSNMGAGIAPQMAKAFRVDRYLLESLGENIDKLGRIDYEMNCIMELDGEVRVYNPLHIGLNFSIKDWKLIKDVYVVNSYTQFRYGKNHTDGVSKPLDYEALTLCMRKINHTFKGKHIGLPKIGAGLAGGDWNRIKKIIQTELKDMQVSVVIYKP